MTTQFYVWAPEDDSAVAEIKAYGPFAAWNAADWWGGEHAYVHDIDGSDWWIVGESDEHVVDGKVWLSIAEPIDYSSPIAPPVDEPNTESSGISNPGQLLLGAGLVIIALWAACLAVVR